jgi:hypothetical protein
MMKKLLVPFFALGIALYGCGSSTTKKKDAGGSGGASGGTGGSTGGTTGTAGRGGTGGSTGGSGGSSMGGAGGGSAGAGGTGGVRADAGAGGTGGSAGAGGAGGAGGARADAGSDTAVARDSSGDTAAGGKPAFCGNPKMIDAATFCAAYMSVCGFGGAMQYASMADCMTSYNGGTSDKDCRALHVCNASGYAKNSGDWTAHCGHAIGGNAVCK